MTTRSTKKPKISAESKTNAINQPTTTDLYYEYNEFRKNVFNEVEKQKDFFAKEIIENGDTIIDDMEENIKKRDRLKFNKINYIQRQTKNQFTFDMLNMLEDFEIESIYNTVKSNNKSFFRKFIEFILGNN